jgi:hypothetical protein
MKRIPIELILAAIFPIPLIGLGLFLLVMALVMNPNFLSSTVGVDPFSDTNSDEVITEAEDIPLSPQAALIATVMAAPDRRFHEEAVVLFYEKGEFFATSGACASCHTNLTDSAGNNVSIDAQWRSTMMANSGRDPYWRAGLRREILVHPEFADYIQDKCATCHLPMARTTMNLNTGEYLPVFGENGALDPDSPYHALAIDSVSCTLCHQIQNNETFGTYEGFSGHYHIDADTHNTARTIYGPFDPDPTQITLMQSSSGYVQTQSNHIQTAELCASCHELYTPFFDVETGELADYEFPEQTPYGEWLHSDFKDTQTCQDCHMPSAEGLVQVANVGDPTPRDNFSRHLFVGGNVYMLRIFRAYGEELGVTATPAQFGATIDATRDQLQNRTATLEITNSQVEEGELLVDLTLTSLTGHKLPASYPSRRAWLHVTVIDEAGNIVFESGAYNPDGSIIGNDNDENPLAFEPHYTEITSPDQVQIYEPILGDTAGNVTTVLLLASQYLKDNRLLPAGFDKTTAPEGVAVHGEASTDNDFIGGSDEIRYRIPLENPTGIYTIQAELVYQTISYRWAQNLREYAGATEIDTFLEYYQNVPNIPEWIAQTAITFDASLGEQPSN